MSCSWVDDKFLTDLVALIKWIFKSQPFLQKDIHFEIGTSHYVEMKFHFEIDVSHYVKIEFQLEIDTSHYVKV